MTSRGFLLHWIRPDFLCGALIKLEWDSTGEGYEKVISLY
jgi:hypothetical protein